MTDMEFRSVAFGASLYVPTTRDDLADVANGVKLKDQRSIIFCTEDAVRVDEVERALSNLRAALPAMRTDTGRFRFIRVRNPAVMGHILQMHGIGKIDGFVLPKVTSYNLGSYLDNLSVQDGQFMVMPTLETKEVFDSGEMGRLRDSLSDNAIRRRIPTLRIGGNDLFNLMGLRRPSDRTIYDTVIGHTVGMLATVFRPHGFNLSGAVFEAIERTDILRLETEQDLAHGLIGKTAIHPEQTPIIEDVYRAGAHECEMARAILDPDAPAVFRMHGTMCEPATHRRAATALLERARHFGIRQGSGSQPRLRAV